MLDVVMVCTGNIARSPLAEQLLRSRLTAIDGVSVRSAGTMAGAGDPMTEQAAALSRRLGGVPHEHRATYLNERILNGATLVFGMDREHRRAVVSLRPALTRSTFALREFARLSSAVSDDALRLAAGSAFDSSLESRVSAAVAEVSAMRGIVPPPEDPLDDDVVDPYRRSERTYELSAAQIVPAVDQVARVVRIAALG